jgi:hypothetical protein
MERDNESLSEARLQAVLTEYQNVRTEIRETIKLHLQLYTIAASGIVVSLGYAFVNQAYDIFLVIPAFTLALLYR